MRQASGSSPGCWEYSIVGLSDGDYNHTTAIILLDAEGRIVARTSELGTVDKGLLAAIHKAAATR